MTVHNDLERAIAMAAAAKGNYLLFATESEDEKATQVFKQMAEDMDRHVLILESRRDYLNQHNALNKAQGDGNQQEQGGGNKQAQNKSGGQGGGKQPSA